MAACGVCGNDYNTRSDGMIRKHGPCEGGGQPPAVEPEQPGELDREFVAMVDHAVAEDLAAAYVPAPDPTPPASLPDVVYLVRTGEASMPRYSELRYSLRSLRNLPSYGRVVIVGYRSPWLQDVVHVPTDQSRHEKNRNMRIAYETIAASDEISEEFILFNDDFFVMKRLDKFRATHRGQLAEQVERHQPSPYWRSMRRVAELLPGDALSYDSIHTPMPMTRTALGKALDMYDGNHGLRTIVGHLLSLGGREHPNAKNPEDATTWRDFTFLSTTEMRFKYGEIGRFVRSHFKKPSPYEVT